MSNAEEQQGNTPESENVENNQRESSNNEQVPRDQAPNVSDDQLMSLCAAHLVLVPKNQLDALENQVKDLSEAFKFLITNGNPPVLNYLRAVVEKPDPNETSESRESRIKALKKQAESGVSLPDVITRVASQVRQGTATTGTLLEKQFFPTATIKKETLPSITYAQITIPGVTPENLEKITRSVRSPPQQVSRLSLGHSSTATEGQNLAGRFDNSSQD